MSGLDRDDIIRIAREADLLTTTEPNGYQVWIPENLERFAALVAAAAREACAKVCDERAAAHPMGSDEQCEAEDCAAAIRARGQQENG
jgi:hypothetical protein